MNNTLSKELEHLHEMRVSSWNIEFKFWPYHPLAMQEQVATRHLSNSFTRFAMHLRFGFYEGVSDCDILSHPDDILCDHQISKDVELGQIILLTESLVSQSRGMYRPVIVAVLENTTMLDEVVIAHFSPFSNPSSSLEFLLQENDPWLGVLCLWGVRRVKRRLLRRAYHIGQLKQRAHTTALELMGFAGNAMDMPERLLLYTGPPIIHRSERDPRAAYQEIEWKLLDRLVGMSCTM